MNELQYNRWKQLSLALARSHTNLTPGRKAKLLDDVKCCIDWVVCNGLETVADWDSEICDKNGRITWGSASSRVEQYLLDNRYELEREYKNGKSEFVRGRFGDMLSACVCAGFDVAVAPSAGVNQFTEAYLRDVFDGEIPDWIADQFADTWKRDAQQPRVL